MTLTDEQKRAIEYFKGWREGDNITITADFCGYADELGKLIGE